MIDDTLRSLENRIDSSSLDPQSRASLEDLIARLKAEIDKLDDEEQAESVIAHTAAGAREALRSEKDDDLLSHTLEGMRKSVRRFEASYPDLTGVVNTICQQLSNLGI
jgi:hypothetical protein